MTPILLPKMWNWINFNSSCYKCALVYQNGIPGHEDVRQKGQFLFDKASHGRKSDLVSMSSHNFDYYWKGGISRVSNPLLPTDLPAKRNSTPLICRAGLSCLHCANNNTTFPKVPLQSTYHPRYCLLRCSYENRCFTVLYAVGTKKNFFITLLEKQCRANITSL